MRHFAAPLSDKEERRQARESQSFPGIKESSLFSFVPAKLRSSPKRTKRKRTDDIRREIEEETGEDELRSQEENEKEEEKRKHDVDRKMGALDRRKPRERVVQSEALHVAWFKEKREREENGRFALASSRDSAFSVEQSFPAFPLQRTIERILSFVTLHRTRNLTNDLLPA